MMTVEVEEEEVLIEEDSEVGDASNKRHSDIQDHSQILF